MLKIGNKVVVTESCDNGISVGKVGEIVDTWAGQYLVGFYEDYRRQMRLCFITSCILIRPYSQLGIFLHTVLKALYQETNLREVKHV